MFDIGWSEMAVIALVALLVVGPKQLPQAMRTFASFSKKMRRYAQDFRSGVDNIIREAELEDAKKALDGVRKANPRKALQDWVDPTGEMTEEINSVEKAAKDKGATAQAAAKTGASGTVEKKALPPAAAAGAAAATAASTDTASPGGSDAATGGEAPVAADGGDGEGEKRGARRVSQPLQVAPAHSIRPPQEAPKPAAPRQEASRQETPRRPATPSVPSPAAATEAPPPPSGDSDEKSGGGTA